VILATHKKTGKEVAIKIIEKKKRKEKEIDLIREEIRILKLCQHPHIVRLLDIFENHNYIYIG
jgi:serine/threonine protein kinase